MKKALLVGINDYPSAPLSGCVNDVKNMADFLVTKCGFKKSEIRLLCDGRATTTEILDRLRWLVKDAQPGDILIFHFSGHGTQVASRSGDNSEVDGLDEVICSYNFDWSESTIINDNALIDIFDDLPEGVIFRWVSDCCHSGDLTRGFPTIKKVANHSRYMTPPADIQWRNDVAKDEAVRVNRLGSKLTDSISTKVLDVGFISGCRSDQTSADTIINGKACGALTHYLLNTLGEDAWFTKSIADVVAEVNVRLEKAGYDQRPQAEGKQITDKFIP